MSNIIDIVHLFVEYSLDFAQARFKKSFRRGLLFCQLPLYYANIGKYVLVIK